MLQHPTKCLLFKRASLAPIHRRHLKQKPKGRFSDWYRDLWSPKKSNSSQPAIHNHVVQLGDPCLRANALPIAPEDIKSDFVQQLVRQMISILGKYDAIGLSAPQVGVPARIAVLQMTKKQLEMWSPEMVAKQGMEVLPLKVLINPQVKVIDNREIVGREGCCSMNGFSALVSRAASVQVKALDADGREFEWRAKDWSARLVQHEMDHMDGKLFVDRMKAESLMFNYWQLVNSKGGQFKMGYDGISGLKYKMFPFKDQIKDWSSK